MAKQLPNKIKDVSGKDRLTERQYAALKLIYGITDLQTTDDTAYGSITVFC